MNTYIVKFPMGVFECFEAGNIEDLLITVSESVGGPSKMLEKAMIGFKDALNYEAELVALFNQLHPDDEIREIYTAECVYHE